MNPPYLKPFETALRHLRSFVALTDLNETHARRLGYVTEDTTIDPTEGPWSAALLIPGAHPAVGLPGRYKTQEEALAALLATVGGNL